MTHSVRFTFGQEAAQKMICVWDHFFKCLKTFGNLYSYKACSATSTPAAQIPDLFSERQGQSPQPESKYERNGALKCVTQAKGIDSLSVLFGGLDKRT